MSLMGRQYPFQFGHECVGIVKNVGAEVHGIAPGDKVFCVGGGHQMVQLANLKVDTVCKIPSTVEDYHLWVGEPLACVVNGLDMIRITGGDRVALIGTGYMGLLNVQLLAASLAAEIIAFDVNDERLQLAKEFGATEVYNVHSEDAEKKIAELIQYGGVDVTFECSSTAEGLQLATDLLKQSGKLSLFAWHRTKRSFDGTQWHMRGLSIFNTSPMINPHFHDQLSNTARLIQKGVLDQKKLITHSMDYHHAADMLRMALEKTDGYIKGVLTF
jgi:threonine dehydrogenase-like Zn-dependent dehydrogenase